MNNRTIAPQQPLVVVAICFILGICIGNFVDIGFVWSLAISLLALTLFVAVGARWLGCVAIICLGGFVSASHGDMERPMHDVELRSLVRVESHNRMSLEAYMDSASGRWRRASEEFYFWGDSSLSVDVGSRYIVDLELREWGDQTTAYLKSSDLLVADRSSGSVARKINDWAYGRLERMGVDPDVVSMSAAMLLGRREMLDRDRRQSYVRAGAAHLLAVSGFHLGLLIAVVSVLFRWLYLLPNGIVWSRVLIICVIIAYAVVVGASASVMRAAVMATMFGISIIFTRRYQMLNALSFAAIVLLSYDSSMIYDVAFRLSFIAVLAIGLWVVPLTRALYRWSSTMAWSGVVRVVFNFVVGALILGVACSLATLPLVANTFGVVSLSGALLSPLVVLTTFVILLVSLLWIFMGLGFLSPLFGALLSVAVRLQDGAVEYMSSGWRDAVDLTMSGWWAVVIYIIYGLLTFLLALLWRGEKYEGDDF